MGAISCSVKYFLNGLQEVTRDNRVQITPGCKSDLVLLLALTLTHYVILANHIASLDLVTSPLKLCDIFI